MSFPTINPPKSNTGSRFFKPAEHDGHLLIFLKTLEKKDEPKYKSNDLEQVAYVNVVDLDGDGETRNRVRVRNPGLVNSLEVGYDNVLGRIKKVQTSQGFDAWVLQSPSQSDQEAAIKWLQADQDTTSVSDDSPWGA